MTTPRPRLVVEEPREGQDPLMVTDYDLVGALHRLARHGRRGYSELALDWSGCETYIVLGDQRLRIQVVLP